MTGLAPDYIIYNYPLRQGLEMRDIVMLKGGVEMVPTQGKTSAREKFLAAGGKL